MTGQSNSPASTQPPLVQRVLGVLMMGAIIGAAIYRGTLRPDHFDIVPAKMYGHASISPKQAQEQYGFSFKECAATCGINFHHEAPQLDPKLENVMPDVASMGASVTVVDYNHDGWPDIFVTNSGVGTQCALYRNNHNGTFTNVTAQVGLNNLNAPGTGVCMGAVWGDYDNSGYPDLFVYKWGQCMLFHNNNGKSFTNVTADSGIPAHANINTAMWFDYNGDGKLDLLLCGYYPSNIDLFHLNSTRMMPSSFEFANNGGPKYLLENVGDGHFKDVTASSGITSSAWTLAALAVPRNPKYPDIFLSNDYGESQYLVNENGKYFKDTSGHTLYWDPSGPGSLSGMNASFGDPLNQGKLSIYVSNISVGGELMQGNLLWMPKQGTSGAAIQYQNMGTNLGIDRGGWSFGAQFADFGNTGNQDLAVTNGFYSGDPNRSYWYDFGKIDGANYHLISDAASWPAFAGRSLAGYERKRLWVGDGEGDFTEAAQMVGFTDRFDGRALAVADLFNDGAQDLLEATERGPLLLYRDYPNPANHWIEFDLTGTLSNRDAIGAVLTLFWNNKHQRQAIVSQEGFCAQNDHRVHFGLGSSTAVQQLVIQWPSGQKQIIPGASLRTDAVNTIKEPSRIG